MQTLANCELFIGKVRSLLIVWESRNKTDLVAVFNKLPLILFQPSRTEKSRLARGTERLGAVWLNKWTIQKLWIRTFLGGKGQEEINASVPYTEQTVGENVNSIVKYFSSSIY